MRRCTTTEVSGDGGPLRHPGRGACHQSDANVSQPRAKNDAAMRRALEPPGQNRAGRSQVTRTPSEGLAQRPSVASKVAGPPDAIDESVTVQIIMREELVLHHLPTVTSSSNREPRFWLEAHEVALGALFDDHAHQCIACVIECVAARHEPAIRAAFASRGGRCGAKRNCECDAADGDQDGRESQGSDSAYMDMTITMPQPCRRKSRQSLKTVRYWDRPEMTERSSAPGSTAAHDVRDVGDPRARRRIVGRERELEVIDALLDRVRHGKCAALFIHGAPGMGKTTLLQETRARFGEGAVLYASGAEIDDGIRYAGLLQLLSSSVLDLEVLPQAQREAIRAAVLLSSPEASDAMLIGLAALTLLTRAADDQPVLCLIDEAHALDEPSLSAFLFAARRLPLQDAAVGIVLAGDSDSSGMLMQSGLPNLELAGFTAEESRLLLQEAFGARLGPDWLERALASTGGNPLGLLALGGSPSATGLQLPLDVGSVSRQQLQHRVRRTFGQRIDKLSAESRRALVIAAAADGSLVLVQRALTAEGIDLEALVPAEDAGLVVLTPDRVNFAHPLLRIALYDEADGGARRAAHASLADACVGDGYLVERAWHLAGAASGYSEEAATALDRAAPLALARAGYADASAAYERAASLTSDQERRSSRLLAAGQAAFLDGDARRSVDLLAQAEREAPDDELRVRIASAYGLVLSRTDRVSDAVQVLRDVAARVDDVQRGVGVLALADAIDACMYTGDAEQAMQCAEDIALLAGDGVPHELEPIVPLATGEALIINGRISLGHWILREAIEQFGNNRPWLAADPAVSLGVKLGSAQWLIGRASEACETLQVMARMSRASRTLGSLPLILERLAAAKILAGDPAASAVAAEEGLMLADEHGDRTAAAMCAATLALLAARRGETGACDTAMEHVAAVAKEDLVAVRARALAARGILALSEESPRHARLALQEAVSLHPKPMYLDDFRIDLVEALASDQRHSEASALVRQLVEDYSLQDLPFALGRLHRAEALVSSGEEAIRLYGVSAAQLAVESDPFELGRTRLAWGRHLLADGDRQRAREELRAARDDFASVEAHAWSALADVEARQAGADQRRLSRRREHLSDKEIEIALLVADGSTNREIAAKLYLSVKAVEYHVTNIYRRLGLKSRAELIHLHNSTDLTVLGAPNKTASK
jgi:DNA-binding CsgD family transcriptional regulator